MGGTRVKNEKTEINPMHKENIKKYKYMLSPRCGAKTRKQTACLSPATRGKKRCRMHGGATGSGAPKSNKNALKHGHSTQEVKAHKREVKMLMKQCLEFMNDS